jgi:hypothetical protein
MKETIFDAVPSTGQKGFIDEAEKIELPKEKSFVTKAKGLGKSALKGGVEGLVKFGTMMGPTGINDQKELTEELNRLLPTEDENYLQRSVRRGLKEAPSFLAFPGSAVTSLPRPLIAGFLGEGAKDLGAPEWAQNALELTAYIGPDLLKKLLTKGSNKEIIEFAKKKGMTDEQITPLIQSEFKQKWLTKLAPKRAGTQKALKSSKEGLSNAYNTIKNSESALGTISEKSERILQNEIDHFLTQMPSEVRGKILQDYKDLFAGPVSGKTLMDFYSKVNHYVGENTKQLSLLKKPIQRVLNEISPQLGKEFGQINNLYSKYFDISARLKPTIASDIVTAAESLGLVSSIVMGQPYTLAVIIGEQGVKVLAQQMLINPHFQQLGRKMVVALNHNKLPLAKKIMEDYIKLIRKTSPEIANKLEDLSDEELELLFIDQKKS